MKLERYELKGGDSLTTFEFISEGAKGTKPKLVQFTPTNLKGLYNLAFGDKDPETGQIDDMVISNNGDSEKVLATVVSTLYAFTDKFPDAWIYATGSTKARTRLYRMGISKYIDEVQNDFIVYGQSENEWKIFMKSVEYEAFIVKRKFSNFEL